MVSEIRFGYRFRHPQLLVFLFKRCFWYTTTSLPHTHRQSQLFSRLPLGATTGSTRISTVSLPIFYDGVKIVKNVRSAGFILGDEGGGTRLGRLFLSDFLKGLVPADVAEPFAKEFDVEYMTVVRSVYKSETPAKYLGSFAPWIMERYGKSDYVTKLVEQNFRDFIERALKQYDIENCPVGVVGGFGYACREILQRVGAEYGVRFSVFLPEPMEGLVKYHS